MMHGHMNVKNKHNKLRSDTSKNFRNKKQKYVKGKTKELAINGGNKNRDL